MKKNNKINHQFTEEELDEISKSNKKQIEGKNLGLESIIENNPLNVQISGSHYKGKGIQPIEYAHANNLDFFQGSVVKYITRFRDKDGKVDLEKAKHIIDLLIHLEY